MKKINWTKWSTIVAIITLVSTFLIWLWPRNSESVPVQSMSNSPGGIQINGNNNQVGNIPRELTMDVKQIILNQLRMLNVSEITFYFDTDNVETLSYANSIALFLKDSGYNIYPFNQRSLSGVPKGVLNVIALSSSTAQIQIGSIY